MKLTLEDYLKDKRFCNDSKHTQIRKHVLTATRNFDNRVKEFMKYIVMSKENPMNTNLFNYRVEFQARGQDIFTGFFGLILIKSYQMAWIIKPLKMPSINLGTMITYLWKRKWR